VIVLVPGSVWCPATAKRNSPDSNSMNGDAAIQSWRNGQEVNQDRYLFPLVWQRRRHRPPLVGKKKRGPWVEGAWSVETTRLGDTKTLKNVTSKI